LRRVAEELRQAVTPSRVHPIQRFPARPLHLPILRRARRTYIRPCRAALERRPHDLGGRRRRVLRLQLEERRPPDSPSPHVSGAYALPAHRARPASERAAVPTELSARKLDGLSLLGFGARAVIRRASTQIVSNVDLSFSRACRPQWRCRSGSRLSALRSATCPAD